jgi:hypothetical protein
MANKSTHNQLGILGVLAQSAQKMTAGRWVIVLLVGIFGRIGISAAQETDTTAYIVLQYEVTDQAMYQEYIKGVRATQVGFQSTLLVSDSNTRYGSRSADCHFELSYTRASKGMVSKRWVSADC